MRALKKSFLLILFSIILVAIALVGLHFFNTYEHYKKDIQKELNVLNASFDYVVQFQKERLIFETNLFLQKDEIAKLFYMQKRDELYDASKGFFQELNKITDKNFKVMHFYNPGGTSFLRVQKKEHFGDNNFEDRPSIVKAEKTHKIQTGFELGIYSMGYRVEYPIFYENKYIGLLDFALDMELFLKAIQKFSNANSAIIIDQKNIPKSKNISDFYVYDDKVIYSFTSDIFAKEPLLISRAKENEIVNIDSRYYSFLKKPLSDFSDDKLAELVFAIDVTDIQKDLIFSFLIWAGGTIGVSIFLIIIIAKTQKKWFGLLEEKNIELEESQDRLIELNKNLIVQAREEAKKIKTQEELIFKQARFGMFADVLKNLSHHWRQPLNAVALGIQNIEDLYENDELTKSELNKIVRFSMSEIKKMSGTIDNFKDYFATNSDKAENFNPVEIIKTISNTISVEFKSAGEIKIFYKEDENVTEIFNDLPIVNIFNNKSDFATIVFNMITNSKDSIMRQIEKNNLKEGEGEIRITLKKLEEKFEICFEDNGDEITQEVAQRIFDPYFSIEDTPSKTGLGLFISKNLVETRLDGKLELASLNPKKFILII